MTPFDRLVNTMRTVAAIHIAEDAIVEGSDEDVVADLVVALLKLICGKTQHEVSMALLLVLAQVIRSTEPADMQPLLMLAMMDLLGGILADND